MTKQIVSSKVTKSIKKGKGKDRIILASSASASVLPNTHTQLRIYRKMISNLKIREDILQSIPSKYGIGPTLIWTEDASDLLIFTNEKNDKNTNYIGFEHPFSNPKSPKYLPKILQKMRMTKGSILIKETSSANPMHIPVHFCAYRVDENGKLTIFDPSWHSADPGIYSTTAFYESLDAFGIYYKHAESSRPHHWQSLLPNDVFCQTWTLQWLYKDTLRSFPLPKTNIDAANQIAIYIKEFAEILSNSVDKYMVSFPQYKLEKTNPTTLLQSILSNHTFAKTIYDMF